MRRWVRADGVLSHHTVGRVVLLAPRQAQPVVVSGAGVAVWEHLARPRSLDELAAALADEYHADADMIAADVEPVLGQLEDHGAVRCQP